MLENSTIGEKMVVVPTNNDAINDAFDFNLASVSN